MDHKSKASIGDCFSNAKFDKSEEEAITTDYFRVLNRIHVYRTLFSLYIVFAVT